MGETGCDMWQKWGRRSEEEKRTPHLFEGVGVVDRCFGRRHVLAEVEAAVDGRVGRMRAAHVLVELREGYVQIEVEGEYHA